METIRRDMVKFFNKEKRIKQEAFVQEASMPHMESMIYQIFSLCLIPKALEGRKKRIQCNFCNKVVSGFYTGLNAIWEAFGEASIPEQVPSNVKKLVTCIAAARKAI